MLQGFSQTLNANKLKQATEVSFTVFF